MQLEQPMQGMHPEDVKESVLGYYLSGHDTIPPEKGIFLGESRRMRPEVCKFISDSFYESRLKPHSSTINNSVNFAAKDALLKEHGIIFVNVDHEDNAQGSDEEVEVIEKIVKSLKGTKITEVDAKAHEFSLEDCLFVAPYNLQVGKILMPSVTKLGLDHRPLSRARSASSLFIDVLFRW